MHHVSYKFRIYPDAEQQVLISRTFGCVRFVWNEMLADAVWSYGEKKTFAHPTPAFYKHEFPWLEDVDSLALCNAWINLKSAFTAFFRDRKKKGKTRRPGFPRFKSRKRSGKSYTTNCVNENVRIEAGKLRLPKLGLITTVFHRHVWGKLKSVTVSMDPSGKFFASILTEQPDQTKPCFDPDLVVGLDFSLRNLVVASDGSRLKRRRLTTLFCGSDRKLARAQRRLSRKVKGSKSYLEQKIHVAKIHEQVRNRRLDFLHKLAKRILDAYDVVVVEDIDLKAMAARGKHRRFGKSIGSLGFGILRELLRNGCLQRGKLFVVADRWYPSSQLCSRCDYQNKATKDLKIRKWKCPRCHTKHDRDTNAAKNLVRYYLEHQEQFSTGASPESNAEGGAVPTPALRSCGKPAPVNSEKLRDHRSRKPLRLRRGR